MPSETHTREGDLQKVKELIGAVDFAMLTTFDQNEMHSRPMKTQAVEFDGDLYFFTYGNSRKAREVAAHPAVNVAYSHPGKQDYLSIAGRAEVIRDRATLEKYWNPMMKAWFPDGLDTPDIALIKVEALSAEYWDSPSSTVVNTVSLAKSLLKGEPKPMGEHGKLKL